ncbi:2-amino-4-hydroxy-6-hydroxymethyldihydropteridine diphosphokinase [Microbacterium pseudoresistens]|uniref:2-amino-4-hydroxy-6-hydroxymethyldihydropteridine diphosphokinase n=2 Tax=Microbacterium pseudoresistens TaxID=640634 RepID=A0A7Y9ETM3_9MICO|nr:2-amino-4-hydroxy-6-hydroxymethyldihydropteridine diphosphokinase [Microbacterium pseudoresistens]NYD53729.1 2-amino-4-hydroxy-6-hydroxymethyldihydropteridine diphosphokinase [Microbacterium pseudoresistens]
MPDPRPGREPVDAVVALGANLGDRAGTIEAAADAIRRLPLVDGVRMSRPVETVALRLDGPDPDAPGYVNAVAIVTTRLAPQVLLGMLHAIEDENGRVRAERWGDRTLDLDLVAYGDVRSDDARMLLPHPRAHERLFVLEPWLDVDPEAVLPGHGRVAALVDALRRDAGSNAADGTPGASG